MNFSEEFALNSPPIPMKNLQMCKRWISYCLPEFDTGWGRREPDACCRAIPSNNLQSLQVGCTAVGCGGPGDGPGTSLLLSSFPVQRWGHMTILEGTLPKSAGEQLHKPLRFWAVPMLSIPKKNLMFARYALKEPLPTMVRHWHGSEHSRNGDLKRPAKEWKGVSGGQWYRGQWYNWLPDVGPSSLVSKTKAFNKHIFRKP